MGVITRPQAAPGYIFYKIQIYTTSLWEMCMAVERDDNDKVITRSSRDSRWHPHRYRMKKSVYGCRDNL